MRTTLNIRDDILAAARARAKTYGISIGDALSDLAERGLSAAPTGDQCDFWKGVKFFPLDSDDPNSTSPQGGVASDEDTQSNSAIDDVERIENLLDSYDVLHACFPDDEFHEAWDPIIEPLLWALPEERDPALLEHVNRLAPSSPLWSMVRRMLDDCEHSDLNLDQER